MRRREFAQMCRCYMKMSCGFYKEDDGVKPDIVERVFSLEILCKRIESSSLLMFGQWYAFIVQDDFRHLLVGLSCSFYLLVSTAQSSTNNVL